MTATYDARNDAMAARDTLTTRAASTAPAPT
jgi:hypothetical protein